MKLNKSTIVTISVIAIVVLVLTGLHFYNKRFEAKYQWETNYVYNNDQPFGVSILYQLLNSYAEEDFEIIDQQNLRDFLNSKTTDSIATYFVIGNHCNYDTEDVKSLKKFAKKGNTVFLTLAELPYNLLTELGGDCDYNYYEYSYQERSTIKANFIDEKLKVKPDYRFFYKFKDENQSRDWEYFSEDFCNGTLPFETLGVINRNKANLIKIKYGRGQILIHSNPLFFTNLHMIRPEAADYAAKVFSYFPKGPIYWDRNSKLWSISENEFSGNDSETPFSYILKQKSLSWAFYMIWALVLLFVLFNLWRKQKAIPVKFPKTNSTLEFIHTIGELYFTQKNNRKLAIQKMNMFVKSVRTKYYITEKDEEKFIQILSKKSEIKESDIQSIFAKYKIIKNSNDELHDHDLVIFYQLLKKFTKNSK